MEGKRVGTICAVFLSLIFLSTWVFAQPSPLAQPNTPEKAPEWKIYMESQTKKYYFNPASVQMIDKQRVRVWEKIAVRTADGEVDSLKSLIELDCSSSKYRVVASKEYDPVTGTDKNEIVTENEPWQYFSQETILGVLWDNVCYKYGVRVDKLHSIPSLVAPPKEEKKEKK